jgi:hypothetical protein
MPTSFAASRLAAACHCPFKEERHEQHDHRSTADDPECLRHDGRAEDIDRGIAGETRQLVKLLVEDDLGNAPNHQSAANGDDDQDHGRGTLDWFDGQTVKQQSSNDSCAHGERGSQRQRQACRNAEDGRHAADHDEFALREVHDIGRVVDNGEAQRDERIDGPYRQARHHELEKLRGHGASAFPLPLREKVSCVTHDG